MVTIKRYIKYRWRMRKLKKVNRRIIDMCCFLVQDSIFLDIGQGTLDARNSLNLLYRAIQDAINKEQL
jgi:hypothetical protein